MNTMFSFVKEILKVEGTRSYASFCGRGFICKWAKHIEDENYVWLRKKGEKRSVTVITLVFALLNEKDKWGEIDKKNSSYFP